METSRSIFSGTFSFHPLLRQRECYTNHRERRFIFPCKERVESLGIFSLAKNVPKTIAFLQHLRPQSLNELRKQFRAYAPHISAAESVDDASTELSFFLGQFRDIYHLPSVRLSFADLMSLRSIVVPSKVSDCEPNRKQSKLER